MLVKDLNSLLLHAVLHIFHTHPNLTDQLIQDRGIQFLEILLACQNLGERFHLGLTFGLSIQGTRQFHAFDLQLF